MVFGWFSDGFRVVLGWFWDGLGIVFGWFLDGFGMVLGWFWDGFGMLLAEKEGREEGTLLRVGREADTSIKYLPFGVQIEFPIATG